MAVSGLEDIEVKVEPSGDAAGSLFTGNALPILHEIATLLERLDKTGESGTIDLRAMPLAPGDHERLEEALGHGEVEASLDSLGTSEVRETAIHGVWWITHYNAHDEVMAEFIEVTPLPEILRTDPADIATGVEELRERLSMLQQGGEGG